MFRAVSKTTLAVCLVAALIGLCGCSGAPVADCQWAKPIYIDPQDQFTDTTAREILEHNQTGLKMCAWRPIG